MKNGGVEWWRGGATLDACARLAAQRLPSPIPSKPASLPVTHSSAGKARGRGPSGVGTPGSEGGERRASEYPGPRGMDPPRARRLSRPQDRAPRSGTGTGLPLCRARDLTPAHDTPTPLAAWPCMLAARSAPCSMLLLLRLRLRLRAWASGGTGLGACRLAWPVEMT